MDVDLNIDIFFDKVRTNGRVLHENAIYLTMRKEYNKSSKGKPPKGEERKKISMKKIMTGALVMSVMLAGGALAEGMNPGTYESTFRGYNADIRVKVAVCADRIDRRKGLRNPARTHCERAEHRCGQRERRDDHLRGDQSGGSGCAESGRCGYRRVQRCARKNGDEKDG